MTSFGLLTIKSGAPMTGSDSRLRAAGNGMSYDSGLVDAWAPMVPAFEGGGLNAGSRVPPGSPLQRRAKVRRRLSASIGVSAAALAGLPFDWAPNSARRVAAKEQAGTVQNGTPSPGNAVRGTGGLGHSERRGLRGTCPLRGAHRRSGVLGCRVRVPGTGLCEFRTADR